MALRCHQAAHSPSQTRRRGQAVGVVQQAARCPSQARCQAVGLGSHQAAGSPSQARSGAETALSLVSRVLTAPCRSRPFQT